MGPAGLGTWTLDAPVQGGMCYVETQRAIGTEGRGSQRTSREGEYDLLAYVAVAVRGAEIQIGNDDVGAFDSHSKRALIQDD